MRRRVREGVLDPTWVAVTALVVAALSLLVPMVFRAGEIWATLHDVRNRANMHEGRLEVLEQGLHDVEL